jgi:hypothetical protein
MHFIHQDGAEPDKSVVRPWFGIVMRLSHDSPFACFSVFTVNDVKVLRRASAQQG